MTNYQIQPGTLYEDFESTSGYTITGGSGVIDNVIYKTGSGSLRLTTTAGNTCVASKTISDDLSQMGVFQIDVFIPDETTIVSIQVLFSSDAGLAKFFHKTITVNAGAAKLRMGWNRIIIGKNEWTNSGGDSWSNTMVRFRVRVIADTGLIAVAYFDSAYKNVYNRPKCLFTFDDSLLSVYTVAYAYMKAKGIKGTVYGNDDRVTNAITKDQSNEMFSAGWDICNHTTNHVNLTTLTTREEMEAVILTCRQTYNGLGYTRNDMHKHFAYPQGGYNSVALAALNNLGFLTARTSMNGGQANYLDTALLLLRTQVADTTTLASLKTEVDSAINRGGCIIFNFHDLVSSTSVSTDWLISDFQLLVDYVVKKQNEIDITTVTDWYKGLSTSRKIS